MEIDKLPVCGERSRVFLTQILAKLEAALLIGHSQCRVWFVPSLESALRPVDPLSFAVVVLCTFILPPSRRLPLRAQRRRQPPPLRKEHPQYRLHDG